MGRWAWDGIPLRSPQWSGRRWTLALDDAGDTLWQDERMMIHKPQQCYPNGYKPRAQPPMAASAAHHTVPTTLPRTRLLSDDLYSSECHFVFELVQNADDNKYGVGVTPTLKIALEAGSTQLIVACNETGFKENQVRALCKIGASTKKHQSGYIGFKSVFKVADKVFVSSGPYKFFFDKDVELGMITPSWADDCPGAEDWTQFTLHLVNTIDREQLLQYLRDVDPTILMFLRKLRHLDIDLGNTNLVVERRDLDSGLISLRRHDRNAGVIVKSDYLPVKGTIAVTSAERKRPNILSTEVVLAFPVRTDGSPKVQAQAVHAFLPIRKYGFSCRPELALMWYKYIPTRIAESFFTPFAEVLLATLQKRAILCSVDGSLRRPSQLFIVKHFDEEGDPLIAEEYCSGYYLSSDYDISDKYSTILYDLGVRDFSDDDLMKSLFSMNHRNGIRSKSESWRESVGTHLLRLRWSYRREIMALRMVPLQDGSWVSLDSGDLFFTSEVNDIPPDLGLRLLRWLNPSSSRYSLFSHFGVRNADPAAISQKILDLHRDTRPSMNAVLRHVHFLFANRDQLGYLDFQPLYLINESRHLTKASEIYMNHEEPGIMPLSDIFSPACLIHQSFLAPPLHRSTHEWHTWLRDVLHVNILPRIVEGALCFEFRSFLIYSKLGSEKVLRALRDYWPRLSPKMSAAYAKKLGGEISVICEDGQRCRLNATAARRKSLQTFTDLHFLPLDDPGAECWNFLEAFGVTMRPDGLMYLKRLKRLRETDSSESQDIISIYKQLEARFDEHNSAIRTAFNEESLIFVESSCRGAARWLSRSDVVWNGPPSMVFKLVLKRIYPELHKFFRIQLEITDSPDDILLQELVAVASSGSAISKEDHKRVSHILKDIGHIIAQNVRDKVVIPPWISKLAAHRIFPVRLADSQELQLRKLDEKFYISDKSKLFFDMFGSRLDMLELDKTVPSYTIQPLLDCLHRPDLLYLDVAVARTFSIRGEGIHDSETQEDFLERIPLIKRLLRPSYSLSRESKVELLRKLDNLVVTRVDSILSTCTVEDLVETRTEELFVKEEPDHFDIWISRDSTPNERKWQFCKRLAPTLGLQREKLSFVFCTDLALATLSLDEEGLGQHAEGDPHDIDDSWASDMALSRVESTETGWKTTRPSTIRASAPSHTESVDGALPTLAGELIMRTGLPTPATLIELNMSSISESAASQSLPRVQASSVDFSFASIGTQNITSDTHNYTVTSADMEASPKHMSSPINIASSSLVGGSADDSRSNGPPLDFTPIRREPRAQAQTTPAEYANGVLGEFFIYEIFRKNLPNFTVDNWTSELRGAVPGFPPYNLSSVADFRYLDSQGTLTSAVFGDAMSQKWAGHWPLYHIEVKSTSDQEQTTAFHLSSRQLDLASQFTLPPDKIPAAVYLLVRVWNIRGARSYTILPDPHRYLYTGGLKIVSNIQAVLSSSMFFRSLNSSFPSLLSPTALLSPTTISPSSLSGPQIFAFDLDLDVLQHGPKTTDILQHGLKSPQGPSPQHSNRYVLAFLALSAPLTACPSRTVV
ncbi:hypothetical protein DFH06DRAFT_1132757 [Mycena polygramma]|nr:hypothetical protein DFH06DRAFT_1132757 [Mycena polygramma]